MAELGRKGERRALPMAGERTRAERRDAAENRQHVLAAAQRLFAARGVAAVSMDEIARAAGVGKGTLYRRYAHKGDLCQALLDDNTRRMQATVLNGLRDRRRSAIDQLAAFLEQLFAHNEENAELLSAISDAALGLRREDFYRSAPYQWQRLMVLGFLRSAVAEGECADLDIEYLADTVLAPLDIHLYLIQRRALGISQERIVAGAQRLLIDGLRRRESTSYALRTMN